MAEYMVDAEEAADEANEVIEQVVTGATKWPGMTYEQGVGAALDWVLGDREEKPFTEE